MGVSVRHNSRLAAVVALVAAVMTVAWFARALQTGAVSDWFWCLVVAAVGVLQLLVVRDGRAPLLLADEHGVRVRHGETWSGLRWQDIAHVDVQSPGSWLRDGRIVVVPRPVTTSDSSLDGEGTPDGDLDDGSAAPESQLPAGTSFVVPLGVTTKVEADGLTGDLVTDLDALASGRVPVVVVTRMEPEKQEQVEADEQVEPAEQTKPEKAPRLSRAEKRAARAEAVLDRAELRRAEEAAAALDAELGVSAESGPEAEPQPAPEPETPGSAEPVVLEGPTPTPEREFEPVEPGRETRPAARSEISRESVRRLPDPPAIPAQRSSATPVLVARVDDVGSTPVRAAEDALIGPMIAAARNRARLSIDTLSERTRIRPHVLECIEVDDFGACGGDFYARGHLRTLARVFGLDPEELLALYDDHYATAEIEARQVFEAELASGIGGGVRAAHTGPRWSVLAACVLALAGIWGVARVFNDQPQELVSPAPNVVDSAGLAKAEPAGAARSTLAPIEVTAAGASPQVVIRDRDSRILWAGKLADGQRQQVIGMAPFDVTASNGAAVKVSYLGKRKGTVGDSSAAGSKQFG
jgi:cytoskeleton protein RodZ